MTQHIVAIDPEDVFQFGSPTIRPLSHPHIKYPGYRAAIPVTCEKMRDSVQLDVGVGDLIDPAELRIGKNVCRSRTVAKAEGRQVYVLRIDNEVRNFLASV
jgi:hypothetical protein